MPIPDEIKGLLSNIQLIPDNFMISFIDNDGNVHYLKSSQRSPFPMEGKTIADPVIQRTVSYRVWMNRSFELISVNSDVFGVPYIVGAFSIFNQSQQFLGVLSLVMPTDMLHRLNLLQEERDILNWLLRVARDVFGVEAPDLLWGQFRDLFLQLFSVTGGMTLVEAHGEIFVQERFGKEILSEADIEWVMEDARNTKSDQGTSRRISLNGNEWVMDRYVLQLKDRREILYLIRAKDQHVHPLMGVMIDYYHLVREIVEQRAMLKELTFIDPLTGIWNRRALEANMEVYFTKRRPDPAVFVLFDLDHFKQLNDQQGHQKGDEALKAISHYARRTLRDEDWVVRLGGDEFVLVLHETTWTEFYSAKSKKWSWWRNNPLKDFGLGMTMGIVEIPREAGNYQEAYRLADQRLYVGKQKGRNCAVYDDSQTPIPLNG